MVKKIGKILIKHKHESPVVKNWQKILSGKNKLAIDDTKWLYIFA
jgi:hypothetical protein